MPEKMQHKQDKAETLYNFHICIHTNKLNVWISKFADFLNEYFKNSAFNCSNDHSEHPEQFCYLKQQKIHLLTNCALRKEFIPFKYQMPKLVKSPKKIFVVPSPFNVTNLHLKNRWHLESQISKSCFYFRVFWWMHPICSVATPPRQPRQVPNQSIRPSFSPTPRPTLPTLFSSRDGCWWP